MKRGILILIGGLVLGISQINYTMSHCNTEGTNGWCNYYEEGGQTIKRCEDFRKEGQYNGKCLRNSGGGGIEPLIPE